ncbi:hypothetical protein BU25DRAFT_444879 [Macroventuria anomochaeta]|uniref:Uncharacterized protein n=1 Tax=Macroventuria anomochaeta TaxID=301207 RepID=A0ACB6SFX2_9PLEO|nr:uncharacterized protein BU25DRAFT_444879 [Macroventuria anomochaeta]KAF2632867.1 hypothetical protein BU25DRAFT_444879 [Macroventuria anomochaeta]
MSNGAYAHVVFWDSTAWLGPACVFAPTCATLLSFTVKTLVNSSTHFAMRGGRDMLISDAATSTLSDGKETMSIGPGPSVKHGLASSGGKIKAYEAVLADGTIATITANNSYSDLYWALGGGGNSFALITRLVPQTFPSITPLLADAHYGSTNATRDAYLATVLSMALHNDEDLAAITIPVVCWGPNYTAPSYESTLFYNGTFAPSSGPFADFLQHNTTGLRALNGTSTLRPISLA